ncbi:MAG: hypothetical protein PWQ48_1833 [Thermotogaceae bacterium]|jgi:hypothetical protein|nr:hypothetical protein [Thermotogaceae bacterium]
MLTPQLGKVIFGIALFIIILGVFSLFFVKPGTPEFAVDLLAILIGFVLILLVKLLTRKT